MAATYTFDIFSTLDGYGSYGPEGDWGGYWGKQGSELLDRRLASFDAEQRMVFGSPRSEISWRCLPRATRSPTCATRGSTGW